MKQKILKELITLSKKASNIDDVPVGAVIVKDNKIISRGYNKRNKSYLTIDHAEVVAIIKACKIEKNWRLSDCDLYISLEPCEMCKKIISEARIRNTYYLLDRSKEKKQFQGTKFKKISIENIHTDQKILEEYKEQLSNFFIDKR